MTRWFILLTLVAGPTSLQGQTHARLLDAVQLLTEGQGDSARSIVREMLTITSAGDAVYPEVVFVSGVVARDARSAQQAFERVAIEFGLSDWADDAMLRLVQLHYAGGDTPTALSWYQRFARDYPTSEVRAEAAFWGARAHFDLQNEADGCAVLDEGREAVGEDVELQNRLDFYARRCATVGVPDSTTPPTSAYFSVQVLAASSLEAVDRTLTQLRAAGLEAAVTRDADGLLKVRVGRFATRDEARTVATDIRRRIGGEPFVVEVTP